MFSYNTTIMNKFHHYNDVGILPGASILEALGIIMAVAGDNELNSTLKSKVFAFPIELEGSPLPLDEPNIIEAAADHNIAMHYWTINKKKDMEELILKGADGIITDRPDLLQEVLIKLGF